MSTSEVGRCSEMIPFGGVTVAAFFPRNAQEFVGERPLAGSTETRRRFVQ